MGYTFLKTIHVATAAVSYVLFVVRGIWRFTDSPLATRRWTRVAPHVNDTVLLLAAVAMASQLARYPGYHAFLAAKVGGLVIYIALGMAAFRASTRRARVTAWLAAQVVFFYIVAVAVTKSPSLGMV